MLVSKGSDAHLMKYAAFSAVVLQAAPKFTQPLDAATPNTYNTAPATMLHIFEPHLGIACQVLGVQGAHNQ